MHNIFGTFIFTMKTGKHPSIQIIIEQNDGLLWGRVEGKNWMPAPYGATIAELTVNLKSLVDDYVLHEGKNDKEWNSINWNKVELVFKYAESRTNVATIKAMEAAQKGKTTEHKSAKELVLSMNK